MTSRSIPPPPSTPVVFQTDSHSVHKLGFDLFTELYFDVNHRLIPCTDKVKFFWVKEEFKRVFPIKREFLTERFIKNNIRDLR